MTQQGCYEISVQIIFILLLAMALGESRLRTPQGLSPSWAILTILAIAIAMAGGQIAALRAFQQPANPTLLHEMTTASISASIAFLVMQLGVTAYRDATGVEDVPWNPHGMIIHLAGLAMGLGALLALSV
jgi:hypothetical protein